MINLFHSVFRGATSVVKTVTQKGTKEKYAMKQMKKNVRYSKILLLPALLLRTCRSGQRTCKNKFCKFCGHKYFHRNKSSEIGEKAFIWM